MAVDWSPAAFALLPKAVASAFAAWAPWPTAVELAALALAFWPTAVALVSPATAPVPHWKPPLVGSLQNVTPGGIGSAAVARLPEASLVTMNRVPLWAAKLADEVIPGRV